MERKYFPDFGVLVPHPPSKPPEPKPPALSHRHRLAPGKHVEKQKPGPTSQQSQQSQRSQTSYFPRGGDSPKVQIPYQTAPGQIPRKLEIERRRREYLKLDIEQLLAEQGIYSNLLMPTHQSSSEDHETTTDNPVSPYLSLQVFDNEDFECRNPGDWLALGIAEKSLEQKPIPAKALLPTDDEIILMSHKAPPGVQLASSRCA
ncbi:hypothetical protein KUCAC02_031105 [Chaenocephalus aceratus]|uniref:Uncharacterized protein n=1 Tax=Chaenocephalus aceratus TaxID=36190 RepID=A0ACB9XM77_CHAAC|nr:hypothetical protein KUCAC02_031105 [Chaenocephalus aceratus]